MSTHSGIKPMHSGPELEKIFRGAFEKIVVNTGVGRASQMPNFEDKVLKQIKHDIASIAGQEPDVRRARKSIAGFKIREGQIIGLRVTLRKKKMFDFFERLIKIVLPRVRDFTGLAISSVDAGGNLNIGIKEQLVFPELNPEKSPFVFSLEVVLVPRIRDRVKATDLYRKLGVPIQKEKGSK